MFRTPVGSSRDASASSEVSNAETSAQSQQETSSGAAFRTAPRRDRAPGPVRFSSPASPPGSNPYRPATTNSGGALGVRSEDCRGPNQGQGQAQDDKFAQNLLLEKSKEDKKEAETQREARKILVRGILHDLRKYEEEIDHDRWLYEGTQHL